jgi:N-acetylglucosamine kinase-like BadF-type ATPase
MSGYVIGVDAGGTSTRAILADAGGTVVGTGRSGGANPNSHPPAEAARHLAEAITAAVGSADPAHARACVIGMAGSSKLADPDVSAIFESAWARLGLACRVRVVSDAEAAFASATPAPDGTVLIAGTGSIAGRVRDRRLVSTVGGYGWLLGDEGSAFWIGREAVRSALAALGQNLPLGGLPAMVLREALGEPVAAPDARARRAVFGRLITLVNGEPPIRLARFAPLVSAADTAGDPVARRITDQAAALLVTAALAAREPGESTPVVLVGSVLGAGSPVGVQVRDGLADAGLAVLSSCDGVLGAAWLAAVDCYGDDAPRPARPDENLDVDG